MQTGIGVHTFELNEKELNVHCAVFGGKRVLIGIDIFNMSGDHEDITGGLLLSSSPVPIDDESVTPLSDILTPQMGIMFNTVESIDIMIDALNQLRESFINEKTT